MLAPATVGELMGSSDRWVLNLLHLLLLLTGKLVRNRNGNRGMSYWQSRSACWRKLKGLVD
jgi:hypothetical protein